MRWVPACKAIATGPISELFQKLRFRCQELARGFHNESHGTYRVVSAMGHSTSFNVDASIAAREGPCSENGTKSEPSSVLVPMIAGYTTVSADLLTPEQLHFKIP